MIKIIDYKKIVPNQKLRLKLLKLLRIIPDKYMLMIQYWLKFGESLNLNNPKKFSEKIQWYKLYYRDPLMTKCTDKYEVRKYIKSKNLDGILNELYGVYDNVSNINFDDLPKKFVLKSTNGGGGNDVIICDDKAQLNEEKTKSIMKDWLNRITNFTGREWSYYNIKPRIICEKYLSNKNGTDLDDYKFFCFNGVPYYVLLVKDRFSFSGSNMGFFDMDFNPVHTGVEEFDFLDESGNRISVEKPKNFQKMIEISRKLSEDFPHVRVDLYNIDGKTYFGELTFYDGSGYDYYGEFDFELGKKFILPEPKVEN